MHLLLIHATYVSSYKIHTDIIVQPYSMSRNCTFFNMPIIDFIVTIRLHIMLVKPRAGTCPFE